MLKAFHIFRMPEKNGNALERYILKYECHVSYKPASLQHGSFLTMGYKANSFNRSTLSGQEKHPTA